MICSLIASFLLSSASGCRLCCNSEDGHYAAYGGVWARTQRDSGRVGSIFSPGGAMVAKTSDRDSVPREKRLYPGQEDFKLNPETPDDADLLPPRQEGMSDEEFERRLKELQQEQFQEIQLVPGEPLPPTIR